jgi:hypothetical protein
VVKESLNVLKVLAGNDNVKRDIAASQGIETIINSVNKHMVSLFHRGSIVLEK